MNVIIYKNAYMIYIFYISIKMNDNIYKGIYKNRFFEERKFNRERKGGKIRFTARRA